MEKMENESFNESKTYNLIKEDMYLKPYEYFINRRIDNFKQVKAQIEKHEGSIYKFASTYKSMCLVPNLETKEIYFKEYAPSAKSLSIVSLILTLSLATSIFGIEKNIFAAKTHLDFFQLPYLL